MFSTKFSLASILFLLFVVVAPMIAVGQSTKHPGIVHFEKKQFRDAIRVISDSLRSREYSNNAELWNILGLAYVNTGDRRNAKRAFETALRLSPNDSAFHSNLAYLYLLDGKHNTAFKHVEKAIELDRKNVSALLMRATIYLYRGELKKAISGAEEVIKIAPETTDAYVLSSNAHFLTAEKELIATGDRSNGAKVLSKAYEALVFGLATCKEDSVCEKIRNESQTLDSFMNFLTRRPDDPVTLPIDDPSITPLKTLKKPLPRYTDSARRNNVSGIVRVAVELKKDGKVGRILVIEGLPNGLSEQAVAAANGITFEPRKVNGQSVSVVVTVEYYFQIF